MSETPPLIFSGRKQESAVWKHFCYGNDVTKVFVWYCPKANNVDIQSRRKTLQI